MYPVGMKNKVVIKRKETLKARVKQEELPWIMNNLAGIVLVKVLVPVSWHIHALLPNSRRAIEFHQSVINRISIYPIEMAISYPKRKSGYFLQIIDHELTENEVLLTLSPTIGMAKARRVIKKRLQKYNPKTVDLVRYEVDGSRLYVVVPREFAVRWVG